MYRLGKGRDSRAELAGPENPSVLALSFGEKEQGMVGWCCPPPGLALGLLWRGFCYLDVL